MDGTTRAKRITDDRAEIMLIVRLATDRAGRSWDAHPLNREPDSVIIDNDTGRPTLLYKAGPIRVYSLWPGRKVRESIVTGSVAFHTTYAETGTVIDRRRAFLGDPQWN